MPFALSSNARVDFILWLSECDVCRWMRKREARGQAAAEREREEEGGEGGGRSLEWSRGVGKDVVKGESQK